MTAVAVYPAVIITVPLPVSIGLPAAPVRLLPLIPALPFALQLYSLLLISGLIRPSAVILRLNPPLVVPPLGTAAFGLLTALIVPLRGTSSVGLLTALFVPLLGSSAFCLLTALVVPLLGTATFGLLTALVVPLLGTATFGLLTPLVVPLLGAAAFICFLIVSRLLFPSIRSFILFLVFSILALPRTVVFGSVLLPFGDANHTKNKRGTDDKRRGETRKFPQIHKIPLKLFTRPSSFRIVKRKYRSVSFGHCFLRVFV